MRQGICTSCKRPAWVNTITLSEAVVGEVCADCFEIEPHDMAPRNRASKGSGYEHNDPWLDNAVKALEDARAE